MVRKFILSRAYATFVENNEENMILSLVLITIGFTGLVFGANWLVDGASSLALRYNIPSLIIGLTIVALGTSAPELVVNSVASIDGLSEIVLANVIGSNNFNLFITLGIAGLIFPITVKSSTAWREIPMSLLVTLLMFGLATDFFISENPVISRLDGIILLVAFAGFLYYMFRQMKSGNAEQDIQAHHLKANSTAKIWTLILIGIAALVIGGKLVVDNSINIATNLGISQKIIGITIIAAGTSLPELVTSVVAAFKKNSDIAIGNVIGSNIFNILLIIAVSALIRPIEYNEIFNQDIYILIGGTLFVILSMFIGKRKMLDRWEALILVCFYLAYTVYLVNQAL